MMQSVRIVLCTVAVLAVAAATAGAAVAPRVTVASFSPLTVSGSGFDRQASVHITVRMLGKRATAVVRSNARGAFRARVKTAFRLSGCTPILLTARSPYHRATWHGTRAKQCGALSVPVDPISP